MRDMFPGFFQLSDDEIADVFKKGIFVLDTNVLLNFYRYSPQTSTDFLSLFHQLGDRLWVPNRVMEEFYRNRKRVIQAQHKIYDEIKKIFQRTQYNLGALLVRGHLSIDLDIVEYTSISLDSILEQTQGYRLKHPDLLKDDTINQWC
jgi:predicted nucleic acid-binding protein